MYYRRKVFLALLDAFGGSVSATDFQKLMFLFCEKTSIAYYDFFPHKFGAFSIVLNQDKLRLVDLGYLAEDEKFQLKQHRSFRQDVDASTQLAIASLAAEYRNIRGRTLLKRTYLTYPYFATRSSIAAEILNPDEQRRVLNYRNNDLTPCLFTIGYEGVTIDAYISRLIANNIPIVVDVRKNPISKKYGFSKNQMKQHLESAGIAYMHFPELGIPSNLRRSLDNAEAYQQLFTYYKDHILPAKADYLKQLRAVLNENRRIALTCFEADYSSCHRSMIIEFFLNDSTFNTPVQHL